MTATYDDTLASDRDKVRFLVGDVVVASALVQDETIDAVLAIQPVVGYAAAQIARAIAATYAAQADTKNGPLSVRKSQRFDHFMALAGRLQAAGPNAFTGEGHISALPVMTGQSIAGNAALEDDDDVIQPYSTRGRDDNNGPDYG